MPIFTYHCKKCDHHFEDLKRISEDMKKAPCPKCGEASDLTEKYLANGVTFRFKGPGFYDTDYRVK